MFRMSWLALLLTTLVACGPTNNKQNEVAAFDTSNFPNVPGQLYGKWHSNDSTSDTAGVPHSLNLYFNSNNQVGYEEVCGSITGNTSVSLVVNGSISQTQIQVSTEQHRSQKTFAGTDCDLDIMPVTFSYDVDNDSLTLTNGSTKALFTRIDQ